jgi:DNA-binding NtrC family response regulator
MSLYIFTKNLRLRAQINTQLQKGCICATDSQSIHTVAKKILADPHPVLIVDENFHERGILPFVEYCISEQIPGPKIFIPKQRKEQSEYVSAGGVAILHRPFTIEQLIICAISVSSIEAVLDHISVEMKKTIEKNYCKNWYSTFLVGESDHIKEVRKIIQQIGNRFKYVHINGESGTGKEIVATLLHYEEDIHSPFEAINCSTIPPTLADAFLFGAKKGAYTDSHTDQIGCVKRSDNGILFLDEIEDLPMEIQGKFLRLLETRKFTTLGSDELQSSNFKLVTASNIELKQLVKEKRLRFDLYNRINKIVISLLPLRERREDILPLITHFLNKNNETRRIEKGTLDYMLEYQWPGNVRELFNTLEQLLLFNSNSETLSKEHIIVESIFSKS